MKNLILLFTALTLVFGTACTGTPNRKAYVAVGVTTSTASSTITAFNGWRATHPLTHDQEQAYANALKTYKDALAVVRATESSLLATNAPPGASADYAVALNAADAAAGALIAVISDIAPLFAKASTH